MICHPFDEHFNQYLREWLDRHAHEYENIDEAVDTLGYELYNRWLNAPAPWLEGHAPGFYFDQFDDPGQLIAWLADYHAQNIPVPAPLLERITALPDAEAPLCALIGDRQASEPLRITAIGLLQEIDREQPLALYLELLREGRGEGPLGAALVDALDSMGAQALEPCLSLMETGGDALRLALLGVLSNFVRNPRVVEYAISLFQRTREEQNRSLLAAYLSKLGDPAALPVLQAAAEDPDIPYLVYVEVRDAVDALGGEPVPERDFSGDPIYEALRGT